MIENALKLHHAQNRADEVLAAAGFTSEEIEKYRKEMPTHVNGIPLPNLIYIINELYVFKHPRLNRLIGIIEEIPA